MVTAYNFIGAWQLFPEKGIYPEGERPVSGTYRVEEAEGRKTIRILRNWLTLEHQSFDSAIEVMADGDWHPFEDISGDTVKVTFDNHLCFDLHFQKSNGPVVSWHHELLPNGYLQISFREAGADSVIRQDVYHRQLSVTPYSSSVSGAVIKPTEEGVIRHKALTAMEEQTNMQLDQIRKQIELLAVQAREIQARKDLSMMIYNARISFQPVIGKIYHLYEKKDGTHQLSLISPKEYGGTAGPYQKYIAPVKLLADHTWLEI